MKNRVNPTKASAKVSPKKPAAKKDPQIAVDTPLTFATMWTASPKFKNKGAFVSALRKAGADSLGAYEFYGDEEQRKIRDFSGSDLEAMQNLLGDTADVYTLYERALIAYELHKRGSGVLADLRKRFKPSTVNSWLNQHATPSEKTMDILRDEFDIEVLEESVVVAAQIKSVLDRIEGKPTEEKKVDQSAPAKPAAKKPAVKKASYNFASVWSEHHPSVDEYVRATFNMKERAIYDAIANGDRDSIELVTGGMLEAMQDKHPKQDIENLYRCALVQHNILDLSASRLAQLVALYGAKAVRSWEMGNAVPGLNDLDEMFEKGFYPLAGSVLQSDDLQQPTEEKAKRTFNDGDEIFDHFDNRDLSRVVHLADDFSVIVDAGYDDQEYPTLVNSRGFRAMMELWPTSFRHTFEHDDDVNPRVWVLQTENFKARVSDAWAEISVEHEAGGFTMRANAENLEDSVRHVFSYFDVLSSDQLGELMHKTLGFENEHVAGVEYKLDEKENYTPQAFYDKTISNSFHIPGNGQYYKASSFLLLAAFTVRGVVFDVGHMVERYEGYTLHVGADEINALYLNPTSAVEGLRKGVASLHEHTALLSGPFVEQMHQHGVFLNGSVLELPLGDEAFAAFHQNSKEAVEKFMSSVTFV